MGAVYQSLHLDAMPLQPPWLWRVVQVQRKTIMTKTEQKSDEAAALRDGQKPGPKDSPVQVRNSGPDEMADKPEKWDKTDEAVDESFPASDSSAKY
ncbi:hypothetical protein [Devosia sp. CAU 1758]